MNHNIMKMVTLKRYALRACISEANAICYLKNESCI